MNSETVVVRQLAAEDVHAFRHLRLQAIQTTPSFVWPTYAEESGRSVDELLAKIQPTPNQVVFGLFKGTELLGLAGLRREPLEQVRHKGYVWGVVVESSQRGKGYARRLMDEIASFAKNSWGATQLNLSVNAENASAKKLYASLGYIRFGIEPNALRVGQQYYDEEHLYLIL